MTGQKPSVPALLRRVLVTFAALLVVVPLVGLPFRVEAVDEPPPVLGGQLYSTGTPVSVTVLSASAGYTSTLFLLSPEEVRIATNRQVGTTVTVGPYDSGTELIFGIRVNGREFQIGPGSRNPDGLEHANVDFGPDGCAVVGFEDQYGGGDRDYDDNRFKFCGVLPEPPEDPVSWTSDAVADAGDDQQVSEGDVVTLVASGSRPGTKPNLASSRNTGGLPGGASLAVNVSGLAPGNDTRLTGAVALDQGPVTAQLTKVSYAIDGRTPVDVSAALGLPQTGSVKRDLDIDLPEEWTPGEQRSA